MVITYLQELTNKDFKESSQLWIELHKLCLHVITVGDISDTFISYQLSAVTTILRPLSKFVFDYIKTLENKK